MRTYSKAPSRCNSPLEIIDPRLVFLERAAARLRLFESADMDLTEAIAGLREAFEEIIGHRLLCPCVRLTAPLQQRRSAA
jgi:hypothetical protein